MPATDPTWARDVFRGGCGIPGCPDPTCQIAYGTCHCGCGETTARARQSDRRLSLIRGDPNVTFAASRVRSVEASAGRAQQPSDRLATDLRTGWMLGAVHAAFANVARYSSKVFRRNGGCMRSIAANSAAAALIASDDPSIR